MADDAVRNIWLFQDCDLLLRQLDGQRADSIVQMRVLSCPDVRRGHRKLHRRRTLLSHLDDDLALCASCFDVSQSLLGRFEWKDSIHNWAYDPGIDERSDLA